MGCMDCSDQSESDAKSSGYDFPWLTPGRFNSCRHKCKIRALECLFARSLKLLAFSYNQRAYNDPRFNFCVF